jgi:hypothetical protein
VKDDARELDADRAGHYGEAKKASLDPDRPDPGRPDPMLSAVVRAANARKLLLSKKDARLRKISSTIRTRPQIRVRRTKCEKMAK